MTQSREYWRKRFEQLLEAQLAESQEFTEEIEELYNLIKDELEKDIYKWYMRFADNNEISLAEAKQWLRGDELAEFHWDVRKYIEYGQKNALDGKWMKQLENASARVHISRLESIKLQMQQKVEELYGQQLDGIESLMKDVYQDSYYHTAYEIQKGFNVGYSLQAINAKQLEQVIAKPWAADGANFSSRIWKAKDSLVNTLHTELTQALIRGDAPDKAIATIAKRFNVSKHQAGRLIMTESAFFASAAQKSAFSDLDVERYEIVATLDHKTSSICQELDGKVFLMSDYSTGVTAPPFHVWCRSVTVPYFDDNYGERIARGKDGEIYYVPSNMAYEEWHVKYVA